MNLCFWKKKHKTWNDCPVCGKELCVNNINCAFCPTKKHYWVSSSFPSETICAIRYVIGQYRIQYIYSQGCSFTSVLDENFLSRYVKFTDCILPFSKFNTPSKCEKLLRLGMLE